MDRINDWQEVNICFFRALVREKWRSVRKSRNGSYMVTYGCPTVDRCPVRVAVKPQGSLSEQISIDDVLDGLWDCRIAEAVSVYYSPRQGCYELSFSARRMTDIIL